MKKDYTKLAENNYWDLTEDEIRQIEEEGYYEAGHWVFYKIDENEYEATRDGVYMHIFKSLKDLMARENEIDAYEYDSDLSDERGQETFINEKGEIRKYRNGGRVGRSRDAMFKSQEPHEQKYNRKREWKEYKKEGWMGDWFAKGGGVGEFKVGDKVRIAYINDGNEHNGEIGTITWLNDYNYYPKGDMSVVEKRTQAEITYSNGDVEEVGNIYREGSGLVSPIEKVKLRKAKEYVNTELIEKLKKEWKEKQYANGGGVESERGWWSIEIEEDDEDENSRNEEVARLIREGYTSGYYPTWKLKTTIDIGDNQEHIASLVEQGYTSGELINEKYANGGGVGLLEDDEKRLKELEDEKEKLKLELLDVSMGIKGGKKQIEAKLGSINDEINNLLKKKYNWKEQYALGGFLSDEELENVSKKINSYINKSGVHIWERKNKRYVPIEVWQYAGQLLEISPRVVSITPIPENNGYLAKAEAINKEGTVISTGFGYVDRKEAKWANSQEYELISFAQTRAVSRVLRNAISYIIRYAGYSTTPAEEMYSVTDEKKTRFGKVEKLKEGEYDFIFDKPGFKQDEKAKEEKREESAPIKTSAYVEAPKDEMLRTIYRKAVGSEVVIGSPEFMEKIKQELLKDYDPEKRRMIVDEAYSYMTQENVVLDSPAFMRKIKKFLADKPMKDGGTLSNPEDISQTIEEHIIEEIKPIIGDYKDYEIDYESYSKDGQTKQVHLEIKGVSPDIMSSVENDYDTIHNKIKELCDKYDLYFTSILTMEDEEEPSITLVFDYFF